VHDGDARLAFFFFLDADCFLAGVNLAGRGLLVDDLNLVGGKLWVVGLRVDDRNAEQQRASHGESAEQTIVN